MPELSVNEADVAILAAAIGSARRASRSSALSFSSRSPQQPHECVGSETTRPRIRVHRPARPAALV